MLVLTRCCCMSAGFLPTGQTLKLESSGGAFQELSRYFQNTKTELSIGATFALKEKLNHTHPVCGKRTPNRSHVGIVSHGDHAPTPTLAQSESCSPCGISRLDWRGGTTRQDGESMAGGVCECGASVLDRISKESQKLNGFLLNWQKNTVLGMFWSKSYGS